MIIAVALTNNNDIAYSIEDTDKFKMYDVLDKCTSQEKVDTL